MHSYCKNYLKGFLLIETWAIKLTKIYFLVALSKDRVLHVDQNILVMSSESATKAVSDVRRNIIMYF